MNETKFEIFYRLLNDDGRAPWQPAGTLDGLVWNGTMQLRITGDAAPLALPFELGNEDILILAVKEHSHDATNTANCIIAQTLTRVDRTTGNVFVYSRSRRTVAGKQQWSEWEALNGATTAMLQDGSVTTPKLAADVREKVDNPLRPLYIAAGAEYNDSGADKTKTAPWGETVTHKAGHYYLNGLGDITEEQMMEIYNAPHSITPLAYAGSGNRTFFINSGAISVGYTSLDGVFAGANFVEAIGSGSEYLYTSGGCDYMFYQCVKLKHIIVKHFILTYAKSIRNIFTGCTSLVTVRIDGLRLDFSLKDSPAISKESVLFIIQKATPSSAITITLHSDAYARLANDADIVAALETQPLVSLVGA